MVGVISGFFLFLILYFVLLDNVIIVFCLMVVLGLGILFYLLEKY